MNKKHKRTAKPLEEKRGKGKQKDLTPYTTLYRLNFPDVSL